MGGSKICFQRVPAHSQNVSVLGSLVFDMRDVLGQKAFLDLSDVTSHSLLARDCIAALYEHASPGRVASDHSISSYAKLIRDLLNYCSCVGVPKHFRMCDINTEFLLNYRA